MSNNYFMPATLLCDFYKVSHKAQYPQGTELIFSTWTPRMTRISRINEVVAFGFQGFVKEYLIDYFNNFFFNRSLNEVVDEYKRVIKYTLGVADPDASHIAELHKLGYLPIMIQAVPEGTKVPIRVPMLTVENTKAEFFWLTNYLETLMSCELWQMSTSASIADAYRKILVAYAERTGGAVESVQFAGHDFSMRGMGSLECAMKSGAGHLLSFVGTDTIPAIGYLEKYYNANIETELVGTSIPATEHSVMCANSNDMGPYGEEIDEYEAYKRIITEVYPNGFISIVSDTWDFWRVLVRTLPALKPEIMARDGRVVIRPDSGDPVLIVCGDPDSATEAERKGAIELLWDTFGGTITDKGYKQLDSHIGCIYGDAITLDRCEEICQRLMEKGFASTNMVYGIGSFTYQYNTRDTFGFALKSTYAVINGKEQFLFKDPKTDNGMKKSQKGLVAVVRDESTGKLTYVDCLNANACDTLDTEDKNVLKPIFCDGTLLVDDSLANIRQRLKEQK